MKPRRQDLWSLSVPGTAFSVSPVNTYLLPGARYALGQICGDVNRVQEVYLGKGRLSLEMEVTDLIPPR